MVSAKEAEAHKKALAAMPEIRLQFSENLFFHLEEEANLQSLGTEKKISVCFILHLTPSVQALSLVRLLV